MELILKGALFKPQLQSKGDVWAELVKKLQFWLEWLCGFVKVLINQMIFVIIKIAWLPGVQY